MDILSIALGVIFFLLFLAMIEGIDRV